MKNEFSPVQAVPVSPEALMDGGHGDDRSAEIHDFPGDAVLAGQDGTDNPRKEERDAEG